MDAPISKECSVPRREAAAQIDGAMSAVKVFSQSSRCFE
jgi:hypothetical protein